MHLKRRDREERAVVDSLECYLEMKIRIRVNNGKACAMQEQLPIVKVIRRISHCFVIYFRSIGS